MQEVSITTEGIQKNLKNFKPLDALCEYIWNGFDAQADRVDVKLHTNEFGLINMISIVDNGTGIAYEELGDEKAKNITSYEVINGYELDSRNIFELDNISEEDFEEEWRVFQAKSDRSSAMNKYFKMDSEGECEFAHRLENNSNVLLFTKLKKGGFVIDTPYGNYSPDWAVVCRKESLSDPSIGIYFVVESKWGKADANLQEVERNKIKCGKLHFEAVSEQVKFDWIKSYDDFKQKFGVAEGSDLHFETTGRNGEGVDYTLRM